MSPTATTAERVDPAASFERRSAALRESWTPEVRDFAASLAAEIDFARRLLEFREAFHLSQRQMATITGEDQGDISRLERRELSPSVDRADRILARLRAYATQAAQPAPQRTVTRGDALTPVSTAAAYLCAIYDEADRDFKILKLQKLLYYAQGYALALLRRPLFPERIKAWTHGPVVPQVRIAYQEFNGKRLPRPEDFDLMEVDPQVRAILDRVYAEYGQYAAWALRGMTHEERPWAETEQSEAIDIQLMAGFFTERLKAKGQTGTAVAQASGR